MNRKNVLSLIRLLAEERVEKQRLAECCRQQTETLSLLSKEKEETAPVSSSSPPTSSLPPSSSSSIVAPSLSGSSSPAAVTLMSSSAAMAETPATRRPSWNQSGPNAALDPKEAQHEASVEEETNRLAAPVPLVPPPQDKTASVSVEQEVGAINPPSLSVETTSLPQVMAKDEEGRERRQANPTPRIQNVNHTTTTTNTIHTRVKEEAPPPSTTPSPLPLLNEEHHNRVAGGGEGPAPETALQTAVSHFVYPSLPSASVVEPMIKADLSCCRKLLETHLPKTPPRTGGGRASHTNATLTCEGLGDPMPRMATSAALGSSFLSNCPPEVFASIAQRYRWHYKRKKKEVDTLRALLSKTQMEYEMQIRAIEEMVEGLLKESGHRSRTRLFFSPPSRAVASRHAYYRAHEDGNPVPTEKQKQNEKRKEVDKKNHRSISSPLRPAQEESEKPSRPKLHRHRTHTKKNSTTWPHREVASPWPTATPPLLQGTDTPSTITTLSPDNGTPRVVIPPVGRAQTTPHVSKKSQTARPVPPQPSPSSSSSSSSSVEKRSSASLERGGGRGRGNRSRTRKRSGAPYGSPFTTDKDKEHHRHHNNKKNTPHKKGDTENSIMPPSMRTVVPIGGWGWWDGTIPDYTATTQTIPDAPSSSSAALPISLVPMTSLFLSPPPPSSAFPSPLFLLPHASLPLSALSLGKEKDKATKVTSTRTHPSTRVPDASSSPPCRTREEKKSKRQTTAASVERHHLATTAAVAAVEQLSRITCRSSSFMDSSAVSLFTFSSSSGGGEKRATSSSISWSVPSARHASGSRSSHESLERWKWREEGEKKNERRNDPAHEVEGEKPRETSMEQHKHKQVRYPFHDVAPQVFTPLSSISSISRWSGTPKEVEQGALMASALPCTSSSFDSSAAALPHDSPHQTSPQQAGQEQVLPAAARVPMEMASTRHSPPSSATPSEVSFPSFFPSLSVFPQRQGIHRDIERHQQTLAQQIQALREL